MRRVDWARWRHLLPLGMGGRPEYPEVPRILHQTWKTDEVPAHLRPLVETWKAHHPEWRYRLWTDDDLHELMSDAGPEIHDLYVNLPYTIQRVDLARYVILLRHGGLYVDLDFECLRPVDTLLHGHRALLGLTPASEAWERGKRLVVSNALMAFPPDDPLLARVVAEIPEALERHSSQGPEAFVLESTGSFMLTRVIESLSRPERRGIHTCDARYFNPFTRDEIIRFRRMPWHADLLQRLSGAYAVHLHEGTWRTPLGPEVETGDDPVETRNVERLHQPAD